MPGKRKKSKGRPRVQKKRREMAQSEEGLQAEKVVSAYSLSPPEVFQHIFKKMDAEDQITFSRTCDEYHGLVSRKRPVFLFRKAAPTLMEYLPQKTLLQCRQLCRSWNQELNHQYQVHPFCVSLPIEIASGGKQIPELQNYFQSTHSIQKFMEDMREHPGNPFPGRNVHLKWQRPVGREGPEILAFRYREFWAKALQLFQQFGSHVYFVTFDYISKSAVRFKQSLAHLPNLKGLNIYGNPAIPIQNYVTERQRRLPQLNNLETFAVQYASEDFIRGILDSCPIPGNMKRLFINAGPFYRIPDVVYSFTNLEVLETRLGILDLQRFSNLAKPPPLKEVQFSFNMSVSAHQVFRALEPFANTLKHFDGRNLTTFGDWRWMNTYINLPNLRRLRLHDFSGALDPFIQLTSLADLTAKPESLHSYENDSKVEFYECKELMKDSNIWKLIPSLKKLTVDTTTYYRPLPPKQNRRSKRMCVIKNAKRYV